MTRGRWLAGLSVVLLVAACGQNSARVASPPADSGVEHRGDSPPNHVDNNGWKYPKDMSAEDTQAGETIAGWLRPKLEALHAKQDFTVESTRKAIAEFGYPDAGVISPRYDQANPGAVFGFSVRGGCIKGGVLPDGVTVIVEGPVVDAGCLPLPPTH